MATTLMKDSIVYAGNDFKFNSIERKGRLIKGINKLFFYSYTVIKTRLT